MNKNQSNTNKLIDEKSPYLLQHAYNPVDWYPWSEEAFTIARQEDKPIFLSIGYSTCHWCHVMERESFEDQEIADLLNKHFVAIKVDREERPDVDHIYMTVCQALTGHGGWPLTVIMTPDKQPFYAGTYFPKEDRWGRPGLLSILNQISRKWEEERDKILRTGQKVTESILPHFASSTKGELSEKLVQQAYQQFLQRFDDKYGGFGEAPKFPTPHNLLFLLRYWKNNGDKQALHMVETTLQSMHNGGIYDHIGFGFARYSTDKEWLVPHFEKMLYDNALLAVAYLEAFQATKKPFYAKVAEEIFAYVLRDMTSPEGGFYSAEDADSEGVEGKFYVWTPEEVKEVLGPEDGSLICEFYDIKQDGNFEGYNIPNLIGRNLDEFIAQNGFTAQEWDTKLEKARKQMFAKREQRVHPLKDDKILTSWNGLMIAALAIGGRVLQRSELTNAAEAAAGFIKQHLVREDGRLLARFREGEAAYPAYVDDYAFLTWGLLELYETTFQPIYLRQALVLNEEMLELFWDEKDGGLFFYGKDSEQLIARPKEIYDGANPSGNSVAALNMLRLARLTGSHELEERANRLMQAFAGDVSHYASAYSFYLTALQFALGPVKEIVIAGEQQRADTKEMLQRIRNQYLPSAVVILHPTENGGEKEEIEHLAPYVKEQLAIDGKTAVYVCENFSCRAPIADPEELTAQLRF